MFKKIIVFLVIIVIVSSMTGCIIEPKSEISFKENVTVIGIDEENGKVKLTIILKLIQPLDDSGSGGQKTMIYYSEGKTVFEAFRNLHIYTEKDIFFGHLHFILIGQETAKKGIVKYLDFFVRDHEIKQDAHLIITKNSTAYDFIINTDRKQTTLDDILTSLSDNVDPLSQSSEVSLQDYVKMMNSDRLSLYLPFATMVDFSEKPEEEKDKKDVKLSGYAVFKEDKLLGFLNGNSARGLNWIIDKIGSGVIVVEDSFGDKVSLEIIDSKREIEVDFSKKEPSAKVKITFTTNIAEYQGNRDIFHTDVIKELIRLQNKNIKKEVESVIEYLQRNETDCAGICDFVYHEDPVISKKYESNWAKIFSEMDISVEVDSTINRSYNIKQPVATKLR